MSATRNLSVRAAYKEYASKFKRAIEDFNCIQVVVRGLSQLQSPFWKLTLPLAEYIIDFLWEGHAPLLSALRGANPPPRHTFRVCVRKRPLLPYEGDDFDVVSCGLLGARLVCHDGRLERNGRSLKMMHRRYVAHRVFGAEADNDQVYAVVRPLVQRAIEGKWSTLLMYGQTGTGKTYTLMAMLERVIGAFFASAEVAAAMNANQKTNQTRHNRQSASGRKAVAPGAAGVLLQTARRAAETALPDEDVSMADLQEHVVELQFIEMYGKGCYDLLNDRTKVNLRSDSLGKVHVRGARTHAAQDASTLWKSLQTALQLRSVEVTERNPISSRSHAFCRLHLPTGGGLSLIDLAGSERNYETTKMTGAQHKESGLINFALMSLKDCFRAQANGTRIPFRASNLTRMVRTCFTDEDHQTVVLATISPSPTDLQHTENSLRHVVLMEPKLAELMEDTDVDLHLHRKEAGIATSLPMNLWTSQQVEAWMVTVEGGAFRDVVLPPGLDGRGLLRLNAESLSGMFEGSLRDAAVHHGGAWTVASEASNFGSRLHRAVRNHARRLALADQQRAWREANKLGDRVRAEKVRLLGRRPAGTPSSPSSESSAARANAREGFRAARREARTRIRATAQDDDEDEDDDDEDEGDERERNSIWWDSRSAHAHGQRRTDETTG